MAFPDDAPREHFETTGEWRSWLEAHHSDSPGIFVVSWRRDTGRPAMTYEAMVEQALCFGWVDSRGARLDEERTMLWFTPRRARSGWARPNKLRIERLTAAGQMHPAGQAIIDAAIEDGSWTLLDEVEDLISPPDLLDAFDNRPGAQTNFESFPRSVRRSILEWIAVAKTAPTRQRRIIETADLAAQGERAHQPR